MRAIATKYLGPTNTRGSRIKAFSHDAFATVSYDSGLRSAAREVAHWRAAEALCRKMGWSGQYVLGSFTESGYVFNRVDGDTFSVEADADAVAELLLCITNEGGLYPELRALGERDALASDELKPLNAWRSQAHRYARAYTRKRGDKGRPYSDATLNTFADQLREHFLNEITEG